MRRCVTLAAALMAGCALAPTISESLGAASATLRGSAVVAQVAADGWSERVDAQIKHCRTLDLPDTAEARAQCMGRYGKGAEQEPDFEALRDAYDEIAGLLEQMKLTAERIEAATKEDAP